MHVLSPERFKDGLKQHNIRNIECLLAPEWAILRNDIEFKLDLKAAMDLDFVYRMLKVAKKGYYVERPVVKMDGAGISSTQHMKVFKERCRVVLDNRDIGIRSAFILTKQFISLILNL